MNEKLMLRWVLVGSGIASIVAGTAAGQTPDYPAPPAASSAPPGYPPPASPTNAPAPGYPPPGYPPSGYPPPGYPPAGTAPAPGSAPAGTPGYAPPTYGQPPPGQGYAPPPGYAVIEPPRPMPPKRQELHISIRLNPLDLIFGKVSGDVEYALNDYVSLALGPEYIFGDPRQDSSRGISASGVGAYGQVGFWIEGRPLRGYYLKAHFAHRSVIFQSDIDRLQVPETLIGAMFGSQSIYAGWFTLSGGFGIAYDLASEERYLQFSNPALGGRPSTAIIPKTGPLENGVDLITQLAIGGSF